MHWVTANLSKLDIPVLIVACTLFSILGFRSMAARKRGQTPHVPKALQITAVLLYVAMVMMLGMVIYRNYS